MKAQTMDNGESNRARWAVRAALVACWLWGRSLDLLLSGEEEAQSMGANVGAVRWWSAIWVSVLVAGAVDHSVHGLVDDLALP